MTEAGEVTDKGSRAPRPPRRAALAPGPPLPRLSRERAEEASLRAELDAARKKGELDRERAVSIALARLLARRDRQRDEAASLGLRAIRIRDDAELRREVAEWLESLGEPALAAAVMGPLAAGAETGPAVTILARVAMLYARAGDAEGAVDVLEEASERDAHAALPLELRGTIAGWAPETLSHREAALAFTRGSERRGAVGGDPFEDLLRAFEVDPTSAVAADALAEGLASRGKRLAADEVRREHGRALRPSDVAGAAAVHRRRLEGALEQNAVARALGAFLDEVHARGGVSPENVPGDLLVRAGIGDALARLEDLFDPGALDRVANVAPTNVRPVLLAFAAELSLERGDVVTARTLAQRACDIEPNYPRSAASLAAAVLEARDLDAAMAIERAIRLVCARGVYCRALSLVHEALGAPDVAVAWAQHTVALRPGDADALERWFRCAALARDAARLGDAISWAVAQPQPATTLAGLVADGLRALVDLDVDRAAVLARRALDAFGPHRPSLRETVELVADRARDDALAAALIERFVSAGAKAGERPHLLVRLAALRSRLGDGDGEAIAYARALREGLEPAEIEGRTGVLRERVRTSDGLLAVLDIEARLAQASSDRERAWNALRAYGAALADLAGDLRGAAQAFVVAARIVPERGPRFIAADLRELAGADAALTAILGVLETESDPRIAGVLAEEGSRAALGASQPGRAFALAKLALEMLPDHTDALEMAELGAAMDGRPADVSPVYEGVARRALGKFGRRAAHFRAARYFERQELFFLALHHASEAFAAVPSEGALGLLRRIAERAQDRAAVVRAVIAVAEASRSKEVRGAWLIRAAELAADDEEGARQRVDILLRGAVAAPDRPTLARLGEAIHRLLTLAPFERDGLSLRVGNAARMLTARASGPDGARIAIELARLAIGAFGDEVGGAHALERALEADADLEEFADLMPHVDAFARVADKVLPHALAVVSKPYANVGLPALRLIVAIAEKAGATDEHATLRALLDKREAPEATQHETLDFSDDASLAAEPMPGEGTAPAAAVAASAPEAEVAPVAAESAEANLTPAVAESEAEASPAPVAPVAEAAPVAAEPGSSERPEEGAPAVALDAVETPRLQLVSSHPPQPPDLIESPTEKTRDLEALALSAARDPALPAEARAERLTAVAATREARGEMEAAAEALIEAAHLEPDSLDRWRAAWTVSMEARRQDHVVTALENIERLASGGERTRVLRQLARGLQDLGRAEEAGDAWRRLLALVPDDEEADQAFELIVSEARDYERLAQHLADRVQRLARHVDRRDSIRAAKLRRAAILEQRLDRSDEACAELEALLKEAPENESALRYLADLYERRGEFEEAAALLRRLAELARGPQTRNDLGLRAAFALRDAGDLRSALGLVKTLVDREPDLDSLALYVEIARAIGDDFELGAALERAALAGRHNPTIAAEMWVEAAQAAARTGNTSLALLRAQRATASDATSAEAQLFARGLEYRERGAGTPTDAESTLAELAKIAGDLADEDVALGAFLRAEALVVLGRTREARDLVTETVGRVGQHPLLSLALAERLAADGDAAPALAMYESALAGDLFGFRARAAVLVAAADLAANLGRSDEAMTMLEEAAHDDAVRDEALRRMVPLALAAGDVARSRALLLEMARRAPEPDRPMALAQLARLLLASQDRAERASGESALAEAVALAEPGSELRATLERDLDEARRRSQPAPPVRESSIEPSGEAEPARAAPSEPPSEAPVGLERLIEPPSRRGSSIPPGMRLADLEAAVRDAAPGAAREQASLALAQAHFERGAAEAGEAVLAEALAAGSVAAGDELAVALGRAGRTPDLVRVRVRLAELSPGDASRLEDLRQATADDKNTIHARAVEHVLRAFDPGAGPLPPPPLVVQLEQPGLLTLLVRAPWPAHLAETFALLHEHAHHVFARDLAAYQLTGVEHVSPGATSAVSRLLEVALRLVGGPAMRVYAKRSADAPRVRALLIDAPAALVTGDVREETVGLRYALGQAIGAAQPENLLLGGLDDGDGRALWDGVVGAFGPADRGGLQLTATSGRFAGALWERLPSRAQRRMQELLAQAAPLPTYDALREVVRQSTRRVGLFLAGNVAAAARIVAAERGLDFDALVQGGGLAALVNDPALADLVRLAIHPAYADARWRPLTPGGAQRQRASGHFPVSS